METAHPILPTSHGYIKGRKCTTLYEHEYYSFEGIPFAKPPLGELRFRAPQPADPWHDVLDCLECAPKPLQHNLFTGAFEGSEDCLYLNVYVKKLQTDKPLPVMVYIYGGAFQNGEANRNTVGPDYFMQEDIVLVTLSYRLGPLGFLCLSDPALKIPGNAGLKDQLAGLRWVKENCINFNGDPNNITLFGESAGGASTHYLLLTNKSQGLLHKAILQSGTVYNKWAHIPQDNFPYRLAKHNGYEGTNTDKEIYEFLMQTKGADLVGIEVTTEEERLNDIAYAFGPTIEPYVGDDCIIPTTPTEMIRNTWSNVVPVMVGGTSFEGLLRYLRVKMNPIVIEILGERPELALPAEIRASKTPEEAQKLGKELLKLHVGDAAPTVENILKYLEITSYKAFWHGFHRTILSRIKYAEAPTFLYRFDFDSPNFNFYRIKYCGRDVRGVAHADDLSYLFCRTEAWKLDDSSKEYETIQRMIGIWTAFAKTSNPNCAVTDHLQWQPVTEKTANVGINIGEELAVIEIPEAKKLAFYDSLYPTEQLI